MQLGKKLRYMHRHFRASSNVNDRWPRTSSIYRIFTVWQWLRIQKNDRHVCGCECGCFMNHCGFGLARCWCRLPRRHCTHTYMYSILCSAGGLSSFVYIFVWILYMFGMCVCRFMGVKKMVGRWSRRVEQDLWLGCVVGTYLHSLVLLSCHSSH